MRTVSRIWRSGWTQFFVICTIAAIPGMLLLLKVAPWNEKKEKEKKPSAAVAPG